MTLPYGSVVALDGRPGVADAGHPARLLRLTPRPGGLRVRDRAGAVLADLLVATGRVDFCGRLSTAAPGGAA